MAEGGDQEDRTEDPTERKLQQAIERGDVARSTEVNTWFVLAGGALAILAASESSASSLTATLKGMLANAHRMPADHGGLMTYGVYAATATLGAMAAPFILMIVMAL